MLHFIIIITTSIIKLNVTFLHLTDRVIQYIVILESSCHVEVSKNENIWICRLHISRTIWAVKSCISHCVSCDRINGLSSTN